MRALVLVALVGCGHTCPKPLPVAPVTIVAPRVPCNLPAIPTPLGAATGRKAPDGISVLVSQEEWAEVGGYLYALSQWVKSAESCIGDEP